MVEVFVVVDASGYVVTCRGDESEAEQVRDEFEAASKTWLHAPGHSPYRVVRYVLPPDKPAVEGGGAREQADH